LRFYFGRQQLQWRPINIFPATTLSAQTKAVMHDPDTLLAHAGCSSTSPTGDLVDPIQLSTTYERGIGGDYPGAFKYSRSGNPTRATLEKTLTALEGGVDTAAFASGMAAASAVFATLPPQSHVIIPNDVYHGVRSMLTEYAERWSLTVTSTDVNSEAALRSHIRSNTRLIWVETPSNPQLNITDLRMIERVCEEYSIAWAADGTWTTPLIQRPFDFGARFVVHSVTKYIAGHSDVLGGAVITRLQKDADSVRSYQTTVGAVLDPFSCWLTLRGMRTLSVRLHRQCENAVALAAHFKDHPSIETVLHPSLTTHPCHEIARDQMQQFGAMMSVLIRGDAQRALEIVSLTKVFRRATSLGGTESLIEHRKSIEGPGSTTPENLVRMSIGIESAGALIADLERALG
jgi:cystathionine gamma-synthase